MKQIKNVRKVMKNVIFSLLGLLLVFCISVHYYQIIGNKVSVLKVLGLNDLPQIDPLGCFETRPLFEVQAFICVKKNDKLVSQSIVKDGAWEGNNVQNLMKAMSFYGDAIFIDAGSNIGMYTVMVAAMDRQVVAVDPMTDNLAYIWRSLQLANRTDKVVLVHNAVSNIRETLYPVPYEVSTDPEEYLRISKEYPGTEKLVDEKELHISYHRAISPAVTSVTLPDIFSSISSETIILKMDIQGYECKALMTPGVFESGHYIPYIFMEWSEYSSATLRSTVCPDLEGLIDLFKHHSYSARDPVSLGIFPASCLHTVAVDVLWVHKRARPIWDEEKVVAC